MTSFSLDTFLQAFLKPPTGTSPEDIVARLRHYIDVANNPSQYSDDHSTDALRAKRRSARQNLRRIALKYPHIAAQLLREYKKAGQ
jgi:hypothetical protein